MWNHGSTDDELYWLCDGMSEKHGSLQLQAPIKKKREFCCRLVQNFHDADVTMLTSDRIICVTLFTISLYEMFRIG